MKSLNIITLIVLTGALFSPAVTFANDELSQSINVRSKLVSFYDLDLNNPADAQKLLNRIQRAAKNVCRKSDHGGDVYAAIDRNRCMESSFRETVAQVDSRFHTDVEKTAGLISEQLELVSKR